MNRQEAEKKLASLRAGAKRNDMVQAGAYDGRFRERAVKPKPHKDPKYKHRLFE